jgi:GNAT superfamily N-acetyltransferase
VVDRSDHIRRHICEGSVPAPEGGPKDGRTAVIRRARSQDAEAVIAHVNAIGAEGIQIMTEKLAITPKEERMVFRKADGKTGLYIVAVIGGEIVGTADIARGRQSKNRHPASFGIALRKDARGVGLGMAIMQTMIAWARSVRLRKLNLGGFAARFAIGFPTIDRATGTSLEIAFAFNTSLKIACFPLAALPVWERFRPHRATEADRAGSFVASLDGSGPF